MDKLLKTQSALEFKASKVKMGQTDVVLTFS